VQASLGPGEFATEIHGVIEPGEQPSLDSPLDTAVADPNQGDNR
jgi:hypothetical protein